MEKRRRMVMIALGSLVALGLTIKVGPYLIKPLTEGGDKLKRAKKEFRDLTEEVAKKTELQDAYRVLALRTLSRKPDLAAKALHALLLELAEKNQLGRPTVSKPSLREFKDIATKANMTVVRVTLGGEGQLKGVVAFLDAFYRLPYMVYITDLTLTPFQTRGGQFIKLDATVETLVLQDNPMKGERPVATAVLEPEKRGKSDRLAGKDLSEYARIFAKDIFAVYVPPPPPQTTSRPLPPTTPRFPVANRPDPQANTVLVLVTRYPWYDVEQGTETLYQEAVTRNEQTKEKRVIRAGETFGFADRAGTLVLVDSTGAVVRTTTQDMYFYPLGKAFTESTRLDPNSQPDLYRAVLEQDRQQ
jgi:hypothetical protein